jgi:hypothetical protein
MWPTGQSLRAPEDESAAHYLILVGGVMAYQGYDG